MRRIKEVLRKTITRVRVEDETREKFWTGKGVRQGCPLSPLLFSVFMADLEETMGKDKWGRVKLGEERIYTLQYADDIVLIAEDEDQLRNMLERFEAYLTLSFYLKEKI